MATKSANPFFAGTLAPAAAPFATLAAAPVAHAIVQHVIGSSLSQPHSDSMDVDPPTNHHNPDGLTRTACSSAWRIS